MRPFRALAIALLSLPLLAQSATNNAADFQPTADAQRLPSGLITKVLKAGNGTTHPADDSMLRLRYVLTTSEGKELARVDPPKEVMLPLSKMIPGWREAALLMTEGETRRAWVNEALGAKGKVPANGYLVIDTQLLEILPGVKTPPDVAAPPADATVTKSGLAYRFLRHGDGTKHPNSGSRVTVHYSGWTTDGKLFDSSFDHGAPAEFPLTGVIRGWTEVLQLMVVGDQVRVWVPERLAYHGERGKPKGMLVFDIALLDVH